MRLLTKIFQPIITIPKNAKIKSTEITCKSQKLLVECGLLRPTSSGLFAILPLARRALDKLEAHIRSQLEAAGAQRLSLPALTPASLWRATGRLDDIGPELMKIKDRHDKQYLLAPTHEEAIADLLADVGPISYKQLPLLLYQITNKYRDEHRPKHGLLRAREFTMMDAYGVHLDQDCAYSTYKSVSRAYRNLFRKLGQPVYRVSAPTGDMGGSLSHEWQLPALAGEDQLSVCTKCEQAALGDRGNCDCGAMRTVTSVEVGHTFLLGTKYSAPLGAHLTPARGPPAPLYMSCYGIGVTRLLTACLDAMSEDNAIRWPRIAAPYTGIVIGPKEGSKEWLSHGWSDISNVYSRLSDAPGLRDDVLVDDRHNMTIGKRMMQADRMGYPFIIVCGKATSESPARYELHITPQPNELQTASREKAPQLLTLDELVATVERVMKDDVISDTDGDDLVLESNKG